MKSIQNIFCSDNPKDNEKLMKKLTATNSINYLQAFKLELSAGQLQDFPKRRFVITPSFICDYKNEPVIFPICNIINVYRTNIINNEYNYNSMALAIETNYNTRMFLLQSIRNINDAEFNNIVQIIRNRISIMNNNLNKGEV